MKCKETVSIFPVPTVCLFNWSTSPFQWYFSLIIDLGYVTAPTVSNGYAIKYYNP